MTQFKSYKQQHAELVEQAKALNVNVEQVIRGAGKGFHSYKQVNALLEQAISSALCPVKSEHICTEKKQPVVVDPQTASKEDGDAQRSNVFVSSPSSRAKQARDFKSAIRKV